MRVLVSRIDTVGAADLNPVIKALAETARQFGIEFVVCITAGPVEVDEGGEHRVFFIDGKYESRPQDAAVAFVAGGRTLYEAGISTAELIGIQRRKAEDEEGAP